MHLRVRAVLLAGAALVTLAPSTAALAAHRVPARSHAGGQGLTWSVVSSPNRKADPSGNQLFGVTCLSATSCAAVGYGAKKDLNNTLVEPKTLVERWNGTAWSIVPSPNRAGLDELQGVSCVSASACTAVGESAASPTSPSSYRTLIETWNGKAWSIVPSPNPGTGTGNFLFSVSCVTAAFCAAVGHFGPPSTAKENPITEIWNGSTWSVVPSPDPGTGDDDFLNGVSCASPTSCVAVGTASHGSIADAVIEAWNGTTWSAVPTLVSTNIDTILNGVSCPSVSMCMAAGTRNATEESPLETLTALGTSSG